MTTVYPGAIDALPRPASNTKRNASGFGLHNVIGNLSDAAEAIEAQLGSTPGVNDLMTMVRLSDGAGKGLWVPRAALGPPLTHNSNYDHFQRGTTARTCTTTYGDGNYSADRWFTLPAGASVTTQRSTTVPDARSQYSLQINGAASVTTVDHGQRIRSAIVATRGLQSQVFSAWVRNDSGAAYTPTLRVGTPGAVDDFTTVTNRLSQSLQSCADAAWTLVHHVFDPSAYTNVANGMEVCLRIPSGSSVSGDTNRIAQFEVKPGTQLASFIPPDPYDELWRVLQYCWAPVGDNLGLAATAALLEHGVYLFPRPMRTTPTISSATFAANAGNAGTVATGASNNRSVYLSNSGAAWTVSAIITFSAIISAEF